MDSVKTIRAVERAFDVLQALQRYPDGATLGELQADTRLSGPTLLRLLKTLMAAQAVRRGLYDRRYRNSVRLERFTRQLDPVDRLGDLASPWLENLCEQVGWPSDLAMHFGNEDRMSVLETTVGRSTFFVRRSGDTPGVNLMMSAAGTAFLAALEPARRAELVEAMRNSPDVHNQKAIALDDLEQRVTLARRRGYAMRHPRYRGGSYNKAPRDDALSALALPLICHDVVFGVVNINWNRSALTEAEMVRRHLPYLRQAVDGIAHAVDEQGILRQLPGIEKAFVEEKGSGSI